MNPKLLIDAIVRQTMVLIAQLSTAAGVRAPLAHVADQVFLDLTRELEEQGVSRKVAADMFGLALRSYQTKVQRLVSSDTERDRTLWEAILATIEERETLSRREIEERFSRDDPRSVAAVLSDLSGSGFIYRTGRGNSAAYRVTPQDERRKIIAAQDDDAVTMLVWVAIYRGGTTAEAIEQQLGLERELVEFAIEKLDQQGRLQRTEEGHLSTTGVVVPVDADHGWEAAVFDHYQALVTALTRKLTSAGQGGTEQGGGTVTFEVSSGHPMRSDVVGQLESIRAQVNALRDRVAEYNELHPEDVGTKEKVTVYFGQSLVPEERS